MGDSGDVYRRIDGKPRLSRVAEIAGQQYGVISLAQLRGVGLTDDAISGQVKRGYPLPLHRGGGLDQTDRRDAPR